MSCLHSRGVTCPPEHEAETVAAVGLDSTGGDDTTKQGSDTQTRLQATAVALPRAKELVTRPQAELPGIPHPRP